MKVHAWEWFTPALGGKVYIFLTSAGVFMAYKIQTVTVWLSLMMLEI